jgi:hypothetical protein
LLKIRRADCLGCTIDDSIHNVQPSSEHFEGNPSTMSVLALATKPTGFSVLQQWISAKVDTGTMSQLHGGMNTQLRG